MRQHVNLYTLAIYQTYRSGLNEIENERENNKDECEPLGHLCKLCIKRLGLALGEEGLSTTGNGTGKAGALTTLHKHDNGNGETGENLKNSEDDGESRHIFQSFRFLQNNSLYNIA